MDMATSYQANRLIKGDTPFGEGTLIFGRMAATDEMSTPFKIDLTLFSEKGDLDPDLVLGKPVFVSIAAGEQTLRDFHGLATDFEQRGGRERLHEYRVTLRPWFWFLTRRADCRVFQGKTVPQIFEI